MTEFKSPAGMVDVVGNTPLVELPTGSDNPAVRLFGKLEGNNPASSVKDRAAWSMIRRAEERGELRRGMTLIEPTSGNTGIALAMIAATRGYAIELVMPVNSTLERVQTMRAFGAKVILTPAEQSIEGSIDYARARASQPGYLLLDQFSNPDNPLAHFETTGPEIWRDTNGTVTQFVSAMGTTGTIMGVSRFLKLQNPNVTIVGCQPTEGAKIPGIRRWPTAYLPKFFDPMRVDRIVDISQIEAENHACWLAANVGLFCGISAAGATLVAQRICNELTAGVVVVVICDRGDRYLSTPVFDQSGEQITV